MTILYEFEYSVFTVHAKASVRGGSLGVANSNLAIVEDIKIDSIDMDGEDVTALIKEQLSQLFAAIEDKAEDEAFDQNIAGSYSYEL